FVGSPLWQAPAGCQSSAKPARARDGLPVPYTLDLLLRLPRVQRKCRTLWIHGVHYPVAPRPLHRSFEDLTAVRFDALGGGVDIGDAEVDLPVRWHVRHLARLVHHAADHAVRAIEHVVLPHLTHVHT